MQNNKCCVERRYYVQDVNLNRFIDRMAQLITKYADAVDWNELPDPDYEKLNIDNKKIVAGTSVSAIFVVSMKKYLLSRFYQ